MTEETITIPSEPKRTIFEGLRQGNFNFYHDTIKVIKYNAYFVNLGFERVNIGEEFGQHTYYPQMTLMIYPTLRLQKDNEVEAEYKGLTRIGIQRHEETFDLWCKYFGDKKGYNGLASHNIIKRSNEDIKPITIEYQGKELMLGQYLKERNIVMLYINPFNTDFSVEKNEYIDLILKLFEDKIKKLELNKVDVSEKMKVAFVEKFKSEINSKMSSIRENVRYNENEINNYQSSLIRAIKSLQVNKKQIDGLIAFSLNTDDTIKKAIEEVKTLPFVSNVNLVAEGIGMDIGDISINYNGENTYIGNYYLIINPDGVKVHCKNPILNKEGTEIEHPHINEDNNCYGGERGQKIVEYLASFELKKLVFYIYMFLKTYTPDDCYNHLSLWTDEPQRRPLKEIKNENDILNASFQGDYFKERQDRGRSDDYEDDEEERDDYQGSCDYCGDSIYSDENGDYINNDDGIFCCDDCLDNYHRDHN